MAGALWLVACFGSFCSFFLQTQALNLAPDRHSSEGQNWIAFSFSSSFPRRREVLFNSGADYPVLISRSSFQRRLESLFFRKSGWPAALMKSTFRQRWNDELEERFQPALE